MSVSSKKHVLFIGEENVHVKEVLKSLEKQDFSIVKAPYEKANLPDIKHGSFNLILLNHLAEEDNCASFLRDFTGSDLREVIPVFLIAEDNINVEDVMWQGATDYIAPSDSHETVLNKIAAVFTDTDAFSGSSAIDITPPIAQISSSGIRVYVIEDDPLLRNLLSIRLDKSNFPYKFDANGENAVEELREFKPDIIVLDLMLPGRSGFEVLSEIKGAADLKNLPVIVFSNRDGQEDRKRAVQLGANAFYVKAMTDLAELIEQIETVTKLR